jgi:hypothetical protein
MKKIRSLCAPLPLIALCGLLASGCESELITPRDELGPVLSSAASEQINSVVQSWELVDTSETDHSEILSASPQTPTLKSGPETGDECNGLEIYVILHDMGATMEVEAHFHNPNEGQWNGELNVDFAREDAPFVRYGVVQNVDAEIAPGGWASLFVLMVKPGIPGVYDFRALGISGKASESFPISPADLDLM